MEQVQKRQFPLWNWIYPVLAWCGDHIFMLLALYWLFEQDIGMVLFSVVLGFYLKLTEIRDQFKDQRALRLILDYPRDNKGSEEHY